MAESQPNDTNSVGNDFLIKTKLKDGLQEIRLRKSLKKMVARKDSNLRPMDYESTGLNSLSEALTASA